MAFLVLYGLGKYSHGTVVKCTAASFFSTENYERTTQTEHVYRYVVAVCPVTICSIR